MRAGGGWKKSAGQGPSGIGGGTRASSSERLASLRLPAASVRVRDQSRVARSTLTNQSAIRNPKSAISSSRCQFDEPVGVLLHPVDFSLDHLQERQALHPAERAGGGDR